ncbi:putative rhomboid protease YdcA [Pullulanibacillus camelliae]|uniref:Putative rhomboid protease YdcA n=1 Tax=Pullulanibacillus camelliae TaxID=1707096 RepID=A0A8J2YG83_9BACL|nr:rhomboid family intramembrane serine protease [Pullulanibacillus camelliae]GGE34368.1 putative rhomboid protease YdcA [Pullulanibacillus camelliae]
MFIRTESFKDFLRLYPIVSFIIAINLLVYVVYTLSAWFHIIAIQHLINLGVGSNVYVIAFHQWWRLITPLFIHLGLSHVFFNCFSIFLFAPALEALLGKWKFAIAYFGSGIIANILQLFFDSPYYYVGASGAIFGLFGVFLFIIALRRYLLDKQSQQVILVILVINVAWTLFFPSNIDVLGHIFGLLAGFVLGPILLFRNHGSYYYRR